MPEEIRNFLCVSLYFIVDIPISELDFTHLWEWIFGLRSSGFSHHVLLWVRMKVSKEYTVCLFNIEVYSASVWPDYTERIFWVTTCRDTVM